MGKQYPPPSLQPRNPVTYEIHRREVFRQITLPLVIVLLILLVTCFGVVFFSFQGTLDTSRLADVSVIWLIIPGLVIALIFTLLFGGMAYGVIWVITQLPPLFLRLFNFIVKVGVIVKKASDKAVEPVLRVESFKASWRALTRRS
jgi:hypothetical protein